MKQILLCLTSIVYLRSAVAQPILTRVDFEPGLELQFSLTGPNDAGKAGANVTWDFSNIQVSNSGTFKSIDPATAPDRATYPDCNFVHNVANGSFYNYFRVTNEKYEWIGYRIGSSGSMNLTKDPLTLLKFPFKYQEKISDTMQSADGSFTAFYNLEYDGYGTLKTPYGTYEDAVRIKRATRDGTDVIYEWYIARPTYPSYAIVQMTSSSTRIYQYHPTSVKDIQTERAMIYPNPSTGTIQTDIPFTKAQLNIYDMSGRMMGIFTVSGKDVIQTNLPAGIYHYIITDRLTQKQLRGKLTIAK